MCHFAMLRRWRAIQSSRFERVRLLESPETKTDLRKGFHLCAELSATSVGKKASDILIEGLHRLEYRGYDSAGIAVPTGDLRRRGHPPRGQRPRSWSVPAPPVSCLPRWASATRAGQPRRPSETNAHPHIDCEGKIAIVHNGIIENYAAPRRAQGGRHTFRSETDTEIVAHLLEKYYDGDLVAAMAKTVTRLEGAYGIAAIHVDHPDQIVVTRKDSPIVVGYAAEQQASLLASDIVAVMNYTRDVIFLGRRSDRQAHARGHHRYDGNPPRSSPRSRTSIGMPRAPSAAATRISC